jgi:hypothetical protein
MMNERQRAKELEQLSAYLDGQLNETEKKQIETRLAQEPDLREAYEGLRKTKLLFSRIRRVRAPRSFALTPEMVKARKPKRSFTVSLRWATSLAAILLVVVFGAEVIFSNPFMARSAEPAAEVYLESIETEADLADADNAASTKAAEPDPLILWGAPSQSGGARDGEAFGMGGGGGDIVEESAPLDVTPEDEALPQDVAPEEPQITDIPTQVRTTDDEVMDGETPILGINPDEAGEIVSSSEYAVTDEPSPSWLATLSPLRWAEIGLAAIVLVGVVLLLIKRRS